MNYNKRNLIYILAILLILNLTALTNVYAEQEISIYINNAPVTFDVAPVIRNGRTLVPFRAIFEAIDANVCWKDETRTALGTKDNVLIELPIGKNYGIVNGTNITLDVPASIVNSRTMVPLRFISENMGFDVGWDGPSRTITLTDNTANLEVVNNTAAEFSFSNVSIGDSTTDLKAEIGNPDRIDASIFNMEWYIYNSDYENYIQYGVKNNKVVAVYTNNSTWESKQGLKYGSSISKANTILGMPERELILANTVLLYDDVKRYKYDNLAVWTFLDKFNGNKLNSILILDYAIECNLKSLYPNKSNAFKIATERQVFDQANAARAKHGLKEFTWDDRAAQSASNHSLDMAENSFFDHINLDNESPFTRMEDQGINYSRASENIAAQQPASFFAHGDWMNSEGHRKNILGNYARLGVGVEFGGPYDIYYTQNFFTPR